jgi:hypothetical protein
MICTRVYAAASLRPTPFNNDNNNLEVQGDKSPAEDRVLGSIHVCAAELTDEQKIKHPAKAACSV